MLTMEKRKEKTGQGSICKTKIQWTLITKVRKGHFIIFGWGLTLLPYICGTKESLTGSVVDLWYTRAKYPLPLGVETGQAAYQGPAAWPV